jgi:hypothetical protein
VTQRLALGASLQLDVPNMSPGFSLHSRYALRQGLFVMQASGLLPPPIAQIPRSLLGPVAEVQAAYVHRISDKVSMAAEMRFDALRGRSSAVLGYMFDMRMGMFQGHVTSAGAVGALLEHRMAVGMSLLMSGTIDYVRSEYSFGFGYTVG